MSEAEQKIRMLVHDEPALAPLLSSHLEDYDDELLPTLFIAEIIDWVVKHTDDAPDVGRNVLRWMNENYETGSEGLRDMIATGGVEAIPNPGQPGAELRDLLSPALHAVDPWDPRWTEAGTQASSPPSTTAPNEPRQT